MKITILTNSKKDGGRCVAGITESGDWIRLVADESGKSLPKYGKTPNLFTVIEADVTPAPLQYQPENAILEEWAETEESIDFELIVKKLNTEALLFGDTSYYLTEDEIKQVDGSLRLVYVQNMEIYKSDKGKWKTRFTYNGNKYEDISMTDPENQSERKIEKAIIVVSLPNEKWGNSYFKFVAMILELKF